MTHALTDVGNAERFVDQHGDDLRYVPAWSTWLVWDGTRWRRDTKGLHLERAKATAASILEEAAAAPDTDRVKLAKHAIASENINRIRAMVVLAQSSPEIPVDPDELDADPWKLNVRTGTLDLSTGQLHSHARADLITKLAPVDYDPAAACPTFERFLDQIQPDADVREFLARWFGYVLTGSTREHKFIVGYGSGANGKTTLTDVFETILGDYARQAAPDLLMRRRDDPHPTGLADLQGARLVLAAETAQGRRLDESLVKRLTGGDQIKARYMRENFFEFTPSHKLMLSTNHKPQIDGTDHGIWRRTRLIPFAVTIADHDQDHELPAKLRREAPGILAWAVQGCLRWQKNGLTEPTAIVAATADYRTESDTLGQYISDHCVLVDGVRARAKDLYDQYVTWAEANGERSMSQKAFGTALGERGLEKRSSNGIVWHGIALKAPETAPHWTDQ